MKITTPNSRRKSAQHCSPDLSDWAKEHETQPHDYAVRWVSRRARISRLHASAIVDNLYMGVRQ
jgi:hypothetical protein